MAGLLMPAYGTSGMGLAGGRRGYIGGMGGALARPGMGMRRHTSYGGCRH